MEVGVWRDAGVGVGVWRDVGGGTAWLHVHSGDDKRDSTAP